MNKRILFPAMAVCALLLLSLHRRSDAEPDVISAASIAVGSTSITQTSAVVTYSNDRYNYGVRTMCYDPAPLAPQDSCQAHNASGNSGSFTINGLKPGTAYNFVVTATDPGNSRHRPYSTNGTFTTQGQPSGLTLPVNQTSAVGAGAAVYDLRGRLLPRPQLRRALEGVTRPVP